MLPDIQRIVSAAVTQSGQRLNAHFDQLYKRLDRLETEYHMLVAGLKPVEERLEGLEKCMDKMALKSELLELKARVDALQAQMQALEERLSAS